MKIHLLRHFQRHPFVYQLTSLNKEGLMRAKTFKFDHPLDAIYSSPFIRCLQSVKPLSISKNLKINVENSLFEHTNSSQFNKLNYNKIVPMSTDGFNINTNYHSFLPLSEVEYNDEALLKQRVKKFIDHLTKQNYENVLLVTHKSTVNSIRSIFDESIEIDSHYPMGRLTTIDTTNY